MLTLYEKLFLILLDDYECTITPSARLTCLYGLAGAMLAELVLQDRLYLKKGHMAINDITPTENKKLDQVLISIASTEKLHKLRYWMQVLSKKKLPKRIAKSLAKKGILEIKKGRCHWASPCDSFPQSDVSAKYQVKHTLRAIVLANQQPRVDTIILLSLLKACRLLNLVFTKDERKAASRKVTQLTKGEYFGEEVAGLIEKAIRQ